MGRHLKQSKPSWKLGAISAGVRVERKESILPVNGIGVVKAVFRVINRFVLKYSYPPPKLRRLQEQVQRMA